MITINISEQALEYKGKSYSISTAKNGIGEVEDSYCTPTGKFKIRAKLQYACCTYGTVQRSPSNILLVLGRYLLPLGSARKMSSVVPPSRFPSFSRQGYSKSLVSTD